MEEQKNKNKESVGEKDILKRVKVVKIHKE